MNAAAITSMRKFAQNLRRLPKVAAQLVATKAAPSITTAAETTFRAGEDPYGNTWRPGADGQRVTLRQTGALARYLRYVAIGTLLRVSLGVAYAKYQIGRRPVYPRQGGALPTAYVRELARISQGVVRDVVEGRQ